MGVGLVGLGVGAADGGAVSPNGGMQRHLLLLEQLLDPDAYKYKYPEASTQPCGLPYDELDVVTVVSDMLKAVAAASHCAASVMRWPDGHVPVVIR